MELLHQASLQLSGIREKYTFGNKEVFMTNCPCCSNQMLRHVRQREVYWFCRECWQEMPVYNLSVSSLQKYDSSPSRNLVTRLRIKKQYSALAVV